MPDSAYRYGKRIDVPYTVEEGETRLYSLTHRQTMALITLSKTLAWKTRYIELPDNADIEEFADRTQRDLMMAIDFCAKVAECIELNENVKEKLRNLIQQTNSPNNNPPGEPLPPTETGRDIAAGTNPDCNPDILFSQSKQLIIYTNRTITDILEKVEVSSNVFELVNSLSLAVPGFSAFINAVGANGAFELINYFQNAVAEQYNAQYTQTIENELACEIFCMAQQDCEITIDRIVSVLENRLSSYFAVPEIEDLVNLIETLAGVNQDTSFVVELAFWSAWKMLQIGNFFFGKFFDRSLELILKLAVNEPDSDWALLCECGMEPATDIGIYVFPGFENVPFGSITQTEPGKYTVVAEQDTTRPEADFLWRIAIAGNINTNYTWMNTDQPANTVYSLYALTGSGDYFLGDTPTGTSGRWLIYYISSTPFTLDIEVFLT